MILLKVSPPSNGNMTRIEADFADNIAVASTHVGYSLDDGQMRTVDLVDGKCELFIPLISAVLSVRSQAADAAGHVTYSNITIPIDDHIVPEVADVRSSLKGQTLFVTAIVRDNRELDRVVLRAWGSDWDAETIMSGKGIRYEATIILPKGGDLSFQVRAVDASGNHFEREMIEQEASTRAIPLTFILMILAGSILALIAISLVFTLIKMRGKTLWSLMETRPHHDEFTIVVPVPMRSGTVEYQVPEQIYIRPPTRADRVRGQGPPVKQDLDEEPSSDMTLSSDPFDEEGPLEERSTLVRIDSNEYEIRTGPIQGS
jgi:hypothetical protein